MDRLKPGHLTREQLGAFLGARPDLVRAFETFIQALAADIPDELNELQVSAANGQAMLAALEQRAQNDRQDAEGAKLLALSAQVDQLREQIARESDATGFSIAAQLAELRELVTVGGSMRVRAINDTVIVPNGSNGVDYTISPPLKSMNALVVLNGSWSVYGTGGGTALLTSTSTLNIYFAGSVPADTHCRFSLVEFLA